MKTILIFIDWFTPGYKAGGPVSSNANMIAHLGREIHFRVVTRNTDYTCVTPYADIIPDNWTQQEGFDGYYISNTRKKSALIRQLVKETTCNMMYINGIYSFYFSILPLWFARRMKKPVMVSARGMLSAHALGVKSWKKDLFLRTAKLTGLYSGVCFHATNEDEAKAIRKVLGNHTLVKVAPNLPVKTIREWTLRKKEIGNLHLISIARISPEKNTLCALGVLQACAVGIKALGGQVTFDLYGPVYDLVYWDHCRKVIEALPACIQVRYMGSIEPAHIPQKLQEAHFLLMPTQGENFGHTILESLQSGCPVIISDRTPWRNLNAVPAAEYIVDSTIQATQTKEASTGVGWDIPLDDMDKYTEIMMQCLQMDQETYESMSRRAYVYAKTITEDQEVIAANRRLFEG